MLPLPIALADLTPRDQRPFWEAMYQTHAPLMYRQALALLRSPHDAQDAVNEAFVALLKHFSTLEKLSPTVLRSYLVITVKHKALDMLRRKNPHPLADWEDLTLADPQPGPEARLLTLADLEAAQAAIGRLAPGQRQLMEMKYLRGLDNAEIAQELGISPDAVRSGLNRARKNLRALAAQEGDTP